MVPEIASKIFDYTLTSLVLARNKLDMEQVNLVVDILNDAYRIVFTDLVHH